MDGPHARGFGAYAHDIRMPSYQHVRLHLLQGRSANRKLKAGSRERRCSGCSGSWQTSAAAWLGPSPGDILRRCGHVRVFAEREQAAFWGRLPNCVRGARPGRRRTSPTSARRWCGGSRCRCCRSCCGGWLRSCGRQQACPAGRRAPSLRGMVYTVDASV